MNLLKQNKGYTLMEIMVVVILIAILSAAGVPYYKDHIERQKAALGISNLKMFTDSVERYMALHNENVPTDLTLLDLDISNGNFSDNGKKYNDGTFTFSTDGESSVLAERNTGEYTLSFSLGDDGKLSCTPTTYCSDKLNISCSES